MVVFLDIDGVLATEDTWDAWFADGSLDARKHELLDPDCVQWVQQLCDRLQARVVISSSWRRAHAMAELDAILKRGGLEVNVVGYTPIREDFDRGLEIADFMSAHDLGETDVLILEDAEEVEPYEHRTIRPWFCGDDAGFRARQYDQAVRLVDGEAAV